jgi:predicted AlkP superfamily phosphohydrolase/phosphomutase
MNEYPEATFVVCSDHGMGFNYEARYYLKALFTRLGWYAPANTRQARFSPKRLVALQAKNMYWFIYKRFPMRYKQKIARLFPAIRGRVEAAVADVGWDRTRISSNDDFFSIVINRVVGEGNASFSSAEEYSSFRDEIIEKLYALEALDTRESLIEKVHTREDLYFGDYVDDGPDLILEWADVRLRDGIRCGDIVIPPEEIEKNELHKILTGEHRPYGILLMKGEMIQRSFRIADGSILDIAPTVLYIAGQPIPRTVDGRVLLEAFSESFRARNPVGYTDVVYAIKSEEEFSFTVEESLEIEERLRGLGYIE